MTRARIHLLLFIGLLLSGPIAQALDLYTLITRDCKIHQGVFVDVQEPTVTMLTLSGKDVVIDRSGIEYLVIHNTVENPIAKINVSPRLKEFMRDIYVDGGDKPSFQGWPIKFVEDLAIFYDSKGKIHVLELYSISKIRPIDKNPGQKLELDATRKKLSMGDLRSHCRQTGQYKQGVRPTRILGDQIQISEFLGNFEKGFRRIRSYQERTYVYAKPFLFARESRLGILVFREAQENPPPILPLYFQWSGGRPYRFQNFNQIGSTPVETLPTADPLMVVRSDVKSHFFHAHFTGNLVALPGGTEYYTTVKDVNDDIEILKGESHSAASLNYMALMGGDIGPWSFSIGTYYPVFMIQVQNESRTIKEFREILASSVTPIYRIMFTKRNYRLRGIFSMLNRKAQSVNDNMLSRDDTASVVGYVKDFEFSSEFVRLGVDIDLTKNIFLSMDEIILNGDYKETLVTNDPNFMKFNHYITATQVAHRFGEYVTLKGYWNYYLMKRDYEFGGISNKQNNGKSVFGGVFEFVF